MTPTRARPRRIVEAPAPGLTKADGAYWAGARAEDRVVARVRAKAEAKAAKKSARATRAPGERRARTPQAELRRLERALKRRKTLAAQQRVRQQIEQLKRSLGV